MLKSNGYTGNKNIKGKIDHMRKKKQFRMPNPIDINLRICKMKTKYTNLVKITTKKVDKYVNIESVTKAKCEVLANQLATLKLRQTKLESTYCRLLDQIKYSERMIEHWGNEFNYCHAMVLKSTKKPTKIQEEIAASILQLIGFKLDLSWNAFQNILSKMEEFKDILTSFSYNAIEAHSVKLFNQLQCKYQFVKKTILKLTKFFGPLMNWMLLVFSLYQQNQELLTISRELSSWPVKRNLLTIKHQEVNNRLNTVNPKLQKLRGKQQQFLNTLLKLEEISNIPDSPLKYEEFRQFMIRYGGRKGKGNESNESKENVNMNIEKEYIVKHSRSKTVKEWDKIEENLNIGESESTLMCLESINSFQLHNNSGRRENLTVWESECDTHRVLSESIVRNSPSRLIFRNNKYDQLAGNLSERLNGENILSKEYRGDWDINITRIEEDRLGATPKLCSTIGLRKPESRGSSIVNEHDEHPLIKEMFEQQKSAFSSLRSSLAVKADSSSPRYSQLFNRGELYNRIITSMEGCPFGPHVSNTKLSPPDNDILPSISPTTHRYLSNSYRETGISLLTSSNHNISRSMPPHEDISPFPTLNSPSILIPEEDYMETLNLDTLGPSLKSIRREFTTSLLGEEELIPPISPKLRSVSGEEEENMGEINTEEGPTLFQQGLVSQGLSRTYKFMKNKRAQGHLQTASLTTSPLPSLHRGATEGLSGHIALFQ